MSHIKVHVHGTGEVRLIGINAIRTVVPTTFNDAQSIISFAELAWYVRESVDEVEALLREAAEPGWARHLINTNWTGCIA